MTDLNLQHCIGFGSAGEIWNPAGDRSDELIDQVVNYYRGRGIENATRDDVIHDLSAGYTLRHGHDPADKIRAAAGANATATAAQAGREAIQQSRAADGYVHDEDGCY